MLKPPNSTWQGISSDHNKTRISLDGVIYHSMKGRPPVIHLAEKIER